ncbi:MAG: hypothetical protein ACPIOQ_68910, partial [Promethearchaeia archaeon]
MPARNVWDDQVWQAPMNWHAGWVRKRGQLNTAFQDRYFVLADGVLRNYKTKEDFDKKHAEQSHLPCRGMTVS